MMSGLFGACLFMYGMPIRRKGLYGFVIFLIVCMAGVFWLTDGKLEAVEQTRKDMVLQDSKNGEVSITGENAHAWVEVYFDGVGWKAVDVTPGYYYNVATLQKMVNTPEQIKKNVALKNNGYKGKQTAGSGKSDRDLTDKMKDAAKNTAMILLGAVTVLVIAGFILFVILEIRLWLLEQTLKKQYEQADMDQKITDCFETIESGNYERACGLMEKTIYGEIELELFEERTVRSFRDKLAEEAKGLAWKEKLKLRYQFQKYCM